MPSIPGIHKRYYSMVRNCWVCVIISENIFICFIYMYITLYKYIVLLRTIWLFYEYIFIYIFLVSVMEGTDFRNDDTGVNCTYLPMSSGELKDMIRMNCDLCENCLLSVFVLLELILFCWLKKTF